MTSEPVRHTRGIDWRSVCAIALATAMLALSTPGVDVVRAEEAAGEPVAAGQTCDAAKPSRPDVTTQLLLQELRRAQAATAPSADEPIVLNNRGFNYGPPPAIDPTIYQHQTR